MGKEVSDRLFPPFFFALSHIFLPNHIFIIFSGRSAADYTIVQKTILYILFLFIQQVEDQINIAPRWKNYENFLRLFCEILRLSLNYDRAIRCLFVFFLKGSREGEKGPFWANDVSFPPQKKGKCRPRKYPEKERSRAAGCVFFLWPFSHRKFLI